MTLKPLSLFLILVIPINVFSQKELTQDQVLEDYNIFKSTITTAHPSLYEYTSKPAWDSIFTAFESQEIHDIKNSDDLFKSVVSMADHAKDGHLNVLHPKMDTIPKLFPLLLKIIDNKLFTDTDDYGFSVGTEIVSINAVPSQKIISSLLKYAPSDGYNLTKKHHQIEKEFGLLHYYEYGFQERYSVSYRDESNLIQTKDLTAVAFEDIGKQYPNRNSHFAPYHNQTNRLYYFKTHIIEPWPFVYYVDSLKLAVLTVNSFGLEPKLYKSKLVELFKQIRKKKVTNLIVDVRQNIGGFRINAINLFSFLTDKAFKQRISESAITNSLPNKDYVIHSVSNYNDFFEKYFANSINRNGRWLITEDHAKSEMIPNNKPFKGKVYVLIGGNTFSAGSAFALSAKNTKEITLVGEETGGGYYFHTAQFSALYELPNSKILVRVPFVKIDKYVLDNSIPEGSGVLPDFEINQSLEDLILGKDSQLDYILNIVANG